MTEFPVDNNIRNIQISLINLIDLLTDFVLDERISWRF